MPSPRYDLLDDRPAHRKPCYTVFCYVLMGVALFFMMAAVFFTGFWMSCALNYDAEDILGLKAVIVDNGSGRQIFPSPPPAHQYARMARYIVHVSDFASLSTISTHEGIESYPFNNMFSISDGTRHNSSGTPYFYLTSMELSVKDLQEDPRVTLTASLAQSSYCRQQKLDPQNPVCAHLILTGEIVKLTAGSEEENFARTALFERHPEMPGWPQDHGWFFARLAIRHIYLLDFFGGAKVIDPAEYYAATPPMATL